MVLTPGLFRLLLAFVVVIHHSFPLRLGAWAVGMFFVLSGFWISRMWRSKYSQTASPYRTFVISRWWRIAPLFVVVQAIAAVLVWSGLMQASGGVLADWRWWVTQPTVIGSTQFGRLLPPSWSLDVEMQFYLVAPIILMGAMRVFSWQLAVGREKISRQSSVGSRQEEESGQSSVGSRQKGKELAVVSRQLAEHGELRAKSRMGWLWVVVLAMLAWSNWRLQHGATLETPRLDVFAWLFLIGVTCDLTDWRPSRGLSIASAFALLGLLALVYMNPTTRPLVWVRGADALPPADCQLPTANFSTAYFFTAICLLSLPFAIRTVHQASPSWDRWLGDLSFPLYLIHWIPREWYYANVDWSAGAIHNGGLLLANFAMAFAAAIALLQFVDRPIQNWRRKKLAVGSWQ